MTTMEGC